jgi:imidazolonepropionase-like amidohydrolase
MSENRIVFVNGQVFDGTGTAPVPADVVVRGDRIESVRPGGGSAIEAGDQVVDCAGATVMPGMVESHAHLTFPSAVGHIDPSFNPPLDVSFFRHMPTPEEHLAIARRNAQILLEAGFTSAYSAGSLTPVPTEVRLREAIAAGATPGPRMRAASFERDNNPVRLPQQPDRAQRQGPGAVRPARSGPGGHCPGWRKYS